MITRAVEHGISDLLINRLNYYDLQNMVIEYDIKVLNDYIKQKSNQKEGSIGRRKATNEEIANFHK